MIGILLGIVALGTILILRYRKRKISRSLQKLEVSEEEQTELWILANKCWDRAREEGISLPSRDVIVCKLLDDPYTWIILKLGIRNREIYRCRMSLQDVAEARLQAETKEEDT